MPIFYRLIVCLAVVGLLIGSTAYAQEPAAHPIPNPRPINGPTYFGSPAEVHPIAARPIPAHPFMRGDESSNIHNDAYMSDTYTHPGPLGVDPRVSSVDLGGICATITFDSHGRLITSCLTLSDAHLFVLDATTLAILDSMPLPYRQVAGDALEFPPGSYFYLDEQGRVILPVVGNEIWRIGVTEAGTFEIETVFDLSEDVPAGDEINSVLPDANGLWWFTTLGGMVGTLDATTRAVSMTPLAGEQIANSFAVDETGGVFVVTDTALYRFDAGEAGESGITWREVYDRGSAIKPGQVSQGSGTTPTVMGADYVVITDNAEPQMHVLVYRRAAAVQGERLVCAVPVFTTGRSATENSVIATAESIIVENNYGYAPLQMAAGVLSEPGLARIDVTKAGDCSVIWTSDERVPTAVSKMSLATGLIYTYTRDPGNLITAPWLFTAIDFATGKTVWEQYVGTGATFNNNYAGVYLASEGAAYVGVTAGIVSIRDAE